MGPSQLSKPPHEISNQTNLISATNIAIEGGEFRQVQIIGVDPGFKLLCRQTVPTAFFNAGHTFDLPKCHPRTRVAVLERIQSWIQGDVDPETSMMWLYGAAGAGKSSIARSIAEWCEDKKLLLASFFFGRSDPQRDNVRPLIATLAYAIIKSVPECRTFIEQAVASDPHIFSLSLKDQLRSLILEPLSQVTQAEIQCRLPHVIIIDGLDECQDAEEQKGTINLFSSLLSEHQRFGFKVLVASRPEYEIRNSFSNPVTVKLTATLALSDEYKADDDIRRYLEDNLNEIKQKSPSKSHFPPDWPSTEDIDELVWKSSGQFIYAATVIKYLSSGKRIQQRLRTILDSVGSTSTTGQAELPFAQLDALYSHILTTGTGKPEVVTRILAVCLLFRCPGSNGFGNLDQSPMEVVADVLELDGEDVDCILEELSSVIRVKATSVDLYHRSMSDFLFDSRRSGKLWVDPSLVWSKLACFQLRYLCNPSNFISCECNIYALIRGLVETKVADSHQITRCLNALDPALMFGKATSEELALFNNLHVAWICLLNFFRVKHNWQEVYHRLIPAYDHWLAGILGQCPYRAQVGYGSIRPYPSVACVIPLSKPNHDPCTYPNSLLSDEAWSVMIEKGQLPKVRECLLEANTSAVSHSIHFLVENAVTDRLVHFPPAPDSRKCQPWLWRKRSLASRISLHQYRPRSRTALLPFRATLSIYKSLYPYFLSSTKLRPKQVRNLVESALKSIPLLLSHSFISSQLVFSLRLASTLTLPRARTSRDFKDLLHTAKKAMRKYLVDVAGLKPKRVGFVFASTIWQRRGRSQLVPDLYEPKRVLRRRVNRKAPSGLLTTITTESGSFGADSAANMSRSSQLHIEN